MNNAEVQELIKILSDAINICDKNNLPYGDELMEIIVNVKDYYNIED